MNIRQNPIAIIIGATSGIGLEVARLLAGRGWKLGIAPAYSATKRFQNTYIEALTQLAHMQKLAIRFTDIRPGFVDTDLLKGGKYPMLMRADKVAARIVKAIERQERIVIIDGRYRLLVFFWRLIPRRIWERLSIHN